MGGVMWTIVIGCAFYAVVLMARVAVAFAFGNVDQRKSTLDTAEWLERQAKEFESRAARWEALHDPDAAEYCRSVSRNYARRAQRYREAVS